VTILVIAAVLFIAFSIALLFAGGTIVPDIGKSLLTGSVIAFAVLGLQLHLDAKRRTEEKRQQFRFSVGFAENLKGLKPQYSLSGMYLSGKTLDNAELQGQDLTATNLQGASLRGANLNGAELIKANLYGAKMTGARIVGADLAHADLRATQLAAVKLDIPPHPADYRGAKVNSKTCWPEDFLAQVHYPPERGLRQALRRKATKVQGRTVVEADSDRSWGRACFLGDESISEDLGLYGPAKLGSVVHPDQTSQTVQQLAVTFGRSIGAILARLHGEEPMTVFGPEAPWTPIRLCAGAKRIPGRIGELTNQGFGFIAVDEPDELAKNTLVIRQPSGDPGQRYVVLLEEPLRAGARVTAVDEKPHGAQLLKFGLRSWVKRCHKRGGLGGSLAHARRRHRKEAKEALSGLPGAVDLEGAGSESILKGEMVG